MSIRQKLQELSNDVNELEADIGLLAVSRQVVKSDSERSLCKSEIKCVRPQDIDQAANQKFVNRIKAQIQSGLRRRNLHHVSAVFLRHKDPTMDSIQKDKLSSALRELDVELGVDEVDSLFADSNDDDALDFEEFQRAVSAPRALEQWAKSIPFTSLIADALTIPNVDDPLRAVTSLSQEAIETVCACVVDGLKSMLLESVMQLKTSFENMEKMRSNSSVGAKFEIIPMSCGDIEDFHSGIEMRIGHPALDFMKAMKSEHASTFCFQTSNYQVVTYPQAEWKIVVEHNLALADMRNQREIPRLSTLMKSDVVVTSKLAIYEVIALVLYTGPMFQLYNTVLRKHPWEVYNELNESNNLFSTTIHVLVSSVIKISRVMKIAPGLRLYRGLGGDRQLPTSFFKSDAKGCRGITEWAFMSTTKSKEVAIQYSGVNQGKMLPMIFEIETGAVDRGACIAPFSQYPREEEYLWVPCSFMEPSGPETLEVTPNGIVSKISVRLNANLKARTTDEWVQLKKTLHVKAFSFLVEELEVELFREAHCQRAAVRAKTDLSCISKKYSPSKLARDLTIQCEEIVRKHESIAAEVYLDDSAYHSLVIESLEVETMAKSMFEWWLISQLSIESVLSHPIRRAQRECIMLMTRDLQSSEGESQSKAVGLCKLKHLLRNSISEVNELGEDCFLRAAAEGESESNLRLLLLAKSDINARTTDVRGLTAAMLAARYGHHETLRVLTKLGADIDAKDSKGLSPVFFAAQNGHCETIRALGELGADLKSVDHEGKNAIMYSANNGYTESIMTLASLNVDPTVSSGGNGWTALMNASKGGHRSAVMALLALKADVNAQKDDGASAALLAAQADHIEVLEELVRWGADVHARTSHGVTSLMLAAQHGFYNTVRQLIALGVDVNASSDNGWTALLMACGDTEVETTFAQTNFTNSNWHHGDHCQVVRVLQHAGADVTATNNEGMSALQIVLSVEGETRRWDMIEALIEIRADVNATSQEGWNAMMFAAVDGRCETIARLSVVGLDVKATDPQGFTALMIAAKEGHDDAVRMLAQMGIPLDAANIVGRTALMLASENGRCEVLKTLVNLGADVNKTDDQSSSALLFAAEHGHNTAITTLISLNADLMASREDGWTALHEASANGHSETIVMLIDLGIDANVVDNDLCTPLMLAACNGHEQAVRTLAARNANPLLQDETGHSAIMFAAEEGHAHIVEILNMLI